MTNDKDEGLTMDKPTGAGEALAKKLHQAFNVAIHREGCGLMPACDGLECRVCKAIAALLAEQQNQLEMAQEAAAMWRTRLAEKLTEQSRQPLSARWQELFWALPPGPMRSKLRALEIDFSNALRDGAEQSRQQEALRDLVKKWEREAERHKIHGDSYRIGQGWAMSDCADELEALLAASPQPKDTP